MSILLTGAVLAGLIPSGYSVLQDGQATGDLNGDKRPDVALALKRADEDKIPDANLRDAPRRLLLVFFAQKDGSYKRVFANETAVLKRNDGGMMGDPWQGLEIERGALVFYHTGGSREMWSYTHRFRLQNGKWRLIGFTDNEFDRGGDTNSSRDANLLTGEVHKSYEVKDKTLNARTFRELRAVTQTSGAILTRGMPSSRRVGPTMPVLRLGTRADVTISAAHWGGPNDCSAQITAGLSNGLLTLRAVVRDNRFTSSDGVQLRDAKGRIVKPMRNRIERTQTGYIQRVSFNWKSLHPREDYTSEALLSGSSENVKPDLLADATIELVDVDNMVLIMLSSSRGKQAAQIRAVTQGEITLPPMKGKL